MKSMCGRTFLHAIELIAYICFLPWPRNQCFPQFTTVSVESNGHIDDLNSKVLERIDAVSNPYL
jgi:hypothetical protein